MVRALYRATRGDMMRYRSVNVIVKRAADVELLRFAVDQGWVMLAPGSHSARLTADGWRAVQ